MVSKQIVAIARPIFMGYMMRELKVSEKAAAFEFDENLTINGVVRLQQSYLTMRRAHDTIVNELGALSRPERKKIYAIFEASLNAASWSL